MSARRHLEPRDELPGPVPISSAVDDAMLDIALRVARNGLDPEARQAARDFLLEGFGIVALPSPEERP